MIRAGGRVGEIYAGLARMRDRYADLVREKFPRIPRRVSGYNLDELLPENGFHVARALVGSEGTCANVVSATLNLTASPPYPRAHGAGIPDGISRRRRRAASRSNIGPIGLEGFDHLLVEFMRRKGLALEGARSASARRRLSAGRDGRVDRGRSAGQGRGAGPRLQALARSARRPHLHAGGSRQRLARARIGAGRHGLCARASRTAGRAGKTPPFLPRSSALICARITALMAEYGYRSPLYGHYGQGCVHMRINFDFRTEEGLRKFREFIDRAADVVLSFGGSLSGEHGDGQARAALLPKMFGPELMQAFREFKGVCGIRTTA